MAAQAQMAQSDGMGPVGVEDVAVEGDQSSVRLLGHGLVLPFESAAGEGVEGFGLLPGTGGLLPGLVVEPGGVRPVPAAELALLGLRHLRREGRPGLLQVQRPDRRVAQHARGIDDEDLGDLGKARVPARVHAAFLHIGGQELGAALHDAVEGVLGQPGLGAQLPQHALPDIAQGAHAQEGQQGGRQQDGEEVEDYPARAEARHEGWHERRARCLHRLPGGSQSPGKCPLYSSPSSSRDRATLQ